MKNSIVLFLSLALAAFITGCATTPKGILITAQRNPDFSPSHSNAISLTLRPNPSREDAFLGAVLTKELANENFNIVTNVNADYTLAYLIEDDSTAFISEHYESDPVPAPAPQNTVQMIAAFGQPYSPDGTYSATLVKTPLVFTDKGIRLYLYSNPKAHVGGLQVVWQGYIGGGRTITPERIPFMVKTLLGYFGQDYSGHIEIGN